MFAVGEGSTEIAVALVEKGAAMDVQDNKVRWRGDCCVTFAKSVYVPIIRVDGFRQGMLRVCWRAAPFVCSLSLM